MQRIQIALLIPQIRLAVGQIRVEMGMMQLKGRQAINQRSHQVAYNSTEAMTVLT